MAWLAVNKNGEEYIYEQHPLRSAMGYWKAIPSDYEDMETYYIELHNGSIKKLIGRELSWSSEPIELK